MDTAQPAGAAENVTPFDAVSAFKAILNPQPEQPRDEAGRFAPKAQPEAAAEPEAQETEAVEAEGETPDAEPADGDAETGEQPEAADEAQPEDDIPLPPSWAKEDADTWETLPAEAKRKLYAREAQREQAINLKFQEAANARKAAEAEAQQAVNNRNQYEQALAQVESIFAPQQRPSRSDYASIDDYVLAQEEWQAGQELARQAQQERQRILAQRQAEEEQAFAAMEAQYRPRLFATVPELSDPARSQAVLGEIVQYVVQSGIPESDLPRLSSLEIELAWKAMQYDKGKAAAQRVKAQAKPQPKPAAPVVKPGVQIPGSLARQTQVQKGFERLDKSGRLEDAAAMFKLLNKG